MGASQIISFTVDSVNANASGKISVVLWVPRAGRFTATAKYGRLSYWRLSVRISRAGRLDMVIAPSRRARSLLRAGRKLRVTLTIVFARVSGLGSRKVVKAVGRGGDHTAARD